jgi:hypothetical protein
MKKLLMFTVLSLFVMGSMAFATQTRTLTMGDAGMIVKDDGNVGMFPQTINLYPKLVGGTISEYELHDFWGHMVFAEESNPMVIGLYFSTWQTFRTYGSPYPGGDWNRLGLVYGRNFGETPFGLGIKYEQASEKMEDAADQSEESFYRWNFNLGITFLENKLELAVPFSFAGFTDKDALGEDTRTAEGNSSFGLMARYWMNPAGKWTSVPHLAVEIGSQGYKEVATDTKHELKTTMFDFGWGLNYDASEDVLFIADIGVDLYKTQFKEDPAPAAGDDEDLWKSIPYFRVGIDAEILSWLDFRGGVLQRWENYQDSPNDTQKETFNRTQTTTWLGLGFHWDNFVIDAWMNPRFFNNGPEFVSGQGGWEDKQHEWNFFPEVTLQYWID